jgi:hypothetical protein
MRWQHADVWQSKALWLRVAEFMWRRRPQTIPALCAIPGLLANSLCSANRNANGSKLAQASEKDLTGLVCEQQHLYVQVAAFSL